MIVLFDPLFLWPTAPFGQSARMYSFCELVEKDV